MTDAHGLGADLALTDLARAEWQNAVLVSVVEQTPTIKSFFLRLAAPFRHVAGQHVDVRLTAPDGYAAMRSYSIASAPSDGDVIELAVERLPNGEVSSFFHDVAQPGDEIELRGPLGGHFVWPGFAGEDAALLIGAGSGVVPLMSMIRQRRSSGESAPTALLLSARTRGDVLFREELFAAEDARSGFSLALTLTRQSPARASDFARRIDAPMIENVAKRLPVQPSHVFICGSNAFVDVAADGVLAAGFKSASIKTERYGG